MENCHFCGTPLLINGKYRLLQPLRSLSSDSHTEVFEIVDEKGTWVSEPGTHKVMKVLNSNDSKLAELLEREALVLQLLDHPGIPKCDIDDGYFSFKLEEKRSKLHCLVIEKIEGQTLEWWLESNKRLSQVLALNWLRQIFEILNTVHKAGFFHRDIKPSNILLKPDGQLVLIDFGGVRDVSGTYLAKVSSGLSSTGSGFFDVTVVRTACYTPLEQINGKAIPQSDFYAIGRTLAYLMTGIPLINLPEDRKTGRLLWRDKAPQIEKPLADFIDDLMAPFPGHRPPNTLVILQYLNKEKGRLQFLLKLWRVITSVQFQASAVVLSSLFMFGSYKILTIWKSNRYLDQASREQREDNPRAARRNFEMAIKNNFNNEEAHHGLALACESLRDFQCAFSEYNEAMRLNRTSWETHYALGNLYEERGNYDLAVEEYNTAIHLGKSLAVDAVNNLARLKNRTKDYKAAGKLASEGLQETSDPISQAALYKNLGWSQFGQHLYGDAKTHLEKAIELDSERTDAYCLLAQVNEAQNDKTNSVGFWDACLRMDSNLPEVQEWRGQILQRIWKK